MMEMRDRFDFESELSENVRTCFYIGGEWRTPRGDGALKLVSPITEQVMIAMPAGSPTDMDDAVAAAAMAFETGPWPRMSPAERGAVIRRMGEAVAARHSLLARAWTAQVGATTGFTDMFTGLIPGYYSYYADLAATYSFEDERPTFQGHAKVVREPVGVCAIILPWNAPLILLSQKLAAGLLAGCAFVVKPSPETPVEALVLAECAEEAGRHIATVCADRVARCGLELGGKSASIICDDADLSSALPALAPVAMPFTGQICFSQTRVLVSDKRHDEVVEAYQAVVDGMRLGDPWEADTAMGPLSMARQHARVLEYIDKGRRDGAKLIRGGTNGGFNRGYFVEPTIFDDVISDMTIAQEEIFGPVVSILRYRDEDEAVAIANNSVYGLSGTVFTRDLGRGEAIARRVRTGNISVNGLQIAPNIPFGGYKKSGLGREGGPEGLEAFLETKAIYMPTVITAC